MEHGLPWVNRETNAMNCDIQPGSIAEVCSAPNSVPRLFDLRPFQLTSSARLPWISSLSASKCCASTCTWPKNALCYSLSTYSLYSFSFRWCKCSLFEQLHKWSKHRKMWGSHSGVDKGSIFRMWNDLHR